MKYSKRPIQTFPRVEQTKRMKFCDLEASVVYIPPYYSEMLLFYCTIDIFLASSCS